MNIFFAVIATVALAFLLLPMCQYIIRPCSDGNKISFGMCGRFTGAELLSFSLSVFIVCIWVLTGEVYANLKLIQLTTAFFRTLVVNGRHGHGIMCGFHSFCPTAELEGLNTSSYRTAHLRCVLGLFFVIYF